MNELGFILNPTPIQIVGIVFGVIMAVFLLAAPQEVPHLFVFVGKLMKRGLTVFKSSKPVGKPLEEPSRLHTGTA